MIYTRLANSSDSVCQTTPRGRSPKIFYLCKQNGWVLPTVYQGMYNLMTRAVEPELFPMLRRFGIAFYAYSPLAGGLLTGRYKYEDQVEKPEGRFFAASGATNTMWEDRYRKRFWKKINFDALAVLEAAIKEEYADAVTPANAALRWLTHHSQLSGAHGDAVILGASSSTHLSSNLLAWERKGSLHSPLAPKVVKAMDRMWEVTHAECPPYFRSADRE